MNSTGTEVAARRLAASCRPNGGRVDGLHSLDGRRVVRHVPAGAEPNLEDLARQALADLRPQLGELLAAQRDIGDARQDPVDVEAHSGILTRCHGCVGTTRRSQSKPCSYA